MQRRVSAGQRFRTAVEDERPLQVVGTVNAACALLAAQQGFRAIYLSGAGVANASYGLPDLGLTSLDDVLQDVRRITSICELPLLVDIDTGWGSVLNIERSVHQILAAGAAAVHLEDQVSEKRCGHRPGKRLVDRHTMCNRIRAALAGRHGTDGVLIARTDAVQSEGLAAAIERGQAYVDAGAEMIFAEALASLEEFATFVRQVDAPILANATEFGNTPLFTIEQFREVGIRIVLYPLTAFRAMNQAAAAVYQTLRTEGTQASLIQNMQTREQLYALLDYHRFEQQMDRLQQPE